jgi:hypothetical protein
MNLQLSPTLSALDATLCCSEWTQGYVAKFEQDSVREMGSRPTLRGPCFCNMPLPRPVRAGLILGLLLTLSFLSRYFPAFSLR